MSMLLKIKQLATQKGITIAELERLTNLSNGQIGKWSKQTPGIDKVEKVANFFNVSIDYLLGRDQSQVMYRLNNEGLNEEETTHLMKELEHFERLLLLDIENRRKKE